MEKPPKQESSPSSNQEKIQFPDISAEIEKMVKEDQDIRELSLDDDEENEDQLAEKMEKWKEIDESNTERMKQIVERIGWPTATNPTGEVLLPIFAGIV